VIFTDHLRVVLDGRTPDKCTPKLFNELLMQRAAKVRHRRAMPNNDGLLVVRNLPLRLRVNTNQVQILPDLFHEFIEVPLVLSRDWHIMRALINDIKLLNRDLIDLVKNIDARYVDSVTFNHIDQLVSSRVASKSKVRV